LKSEYLYSLNSSEILNELQNVEQDTQIICQSLEQSEKYSNKIRRFTKDVAIILGGISLGALGFLAGPIVGVTTLLSGATVSSGIVIASKKR